MINEEIYKQLKERRRQEEREREFRQLCIMYNVCQKCGGKMRIIKKRNFLNHDITHECEKCGNIYKEIYY